MYALPCDHVFDLIYRYLFSNSFIGVQVSALYDIVAVQVPDNKLILRNVNNRQHQNTLFFSIFVFFLSGRKINADKFLAFLLQRKNVLGTRLTSII